MKELLGVLTMVLLRHLEVTVLQQVEKVALMVITIIVMVELVE